VPDDKTAQTLPLRREGIHNHDVPLLVADNIGKVYDDGIPYRALEGVCFTLGRGEFASIVGQSGSGKSTLLNQLGLLDTPSEGVVTIDGTDTAKAGKKGRAVLRNELIGFIFQFHYLLPEFSVLENVLMPARIAGNSDEETRRRALETLGYIGLEKEADKGANELSGGQKQRVAIARALMNRPELLLADEPTGNLDTVNSKAVYELFRQISRDWGTSFLIVTHDRAIAERTDRILEIQDGHLIQDVRNDYAAKRSEEVPEEVVQARGDGPRPDAQTTGTSASETGPTVP
jgi:lipoprotein-releasing system ATP-binding protein